MELSPFLPWSTLIRWGWRWVQTQLAEDPKPVHGGNGHRGHPDVDDRADGGQPHRDRVRRDPQYAHQVAQSTEVMEQVIPGSMMTSPSSSMTMM